MQSCKVNLRRRHLDSSKMVFSVGLAIVFLTTIAATSQAQKEKPGGDELSEDVSTLKRDLNTLRTEQRDIIEQINELKQLLPTKTVSTPIEPLLPTALNIRGEGFKGDEGAKVAIVEYADFECPYCGEYQRKVYPQILEDYIHTSKVRYFFRDFPLLMHPHAIPAARAAHCAGEQGRYWEMHDSLFAKQNLLRDIDMTARAKDIGLDEAKFTECLASDRYTTEIQQSATEAQKMGFAGTPTFIIGWVNRDTISVRKVIVGARAYDEFKSAIDGLLAAKGQ